VLDDRNKKATQWVALRVAPIQNEFLKLLFPDDFRISVISVDQW